MKRFAAALIPVLACLALAGDGRAKPMPAGTSRPESTAAPTQLPGTAEPVAYDLTVTPDARALTFAGHVTITVQVPRPTRRIVLNAAELAIGRAALDGGPPAQVKTDDEAETATFSFTRQVSPGLHVLAIDYTGKIHARPAGLFKVDYDTPAGRGAGRMLATQFEPADARRFLPCFDEPAKKAVFTVSAVVPSGWMALSNMPETAREVLAGGLTRVRFAPTPRMASYLLFFGAGDLERTSAEVDGTRVGVVLPRGQAEKGRFALQAATELLHYYNGYFGTRFPLPKLDLIGAPGDTGGAMENWGAIQFQQTYLFVDPKLSTDADRQEVYNTIAHEMAHQWFGDLVTMRWWDDLWLNEAFASWMATKASDRFHPEWKPILWALSDKDSAMRLDALASTHPIVRPIKTVAQSEQAFDDITYEKGEAVLRMLESYAGEDVWRAGVRSYMARHAYGSTVGDDLWAEMDRAMMGAAPRAGAGAISRIAHDFTRQPGVPLVNVETACGPAPTATLRQGRFSVGAAPEPQASWRIPVAVGGRTLLLDRAPVRTSAGPTQGDCCPALVVNAGQRGYFRSAYGGSARSALLKRFPDLPIADQIGLLNDSFALGLAGYQPIGAALDFAAALPASADAVVWDTAEERLLFLDAVHPDGPGRTAYRAWAMARLRPVLARVGYDKRAGEGANFAIMRQSVIGALSRLGDPEVIAEARRRFEGFRRDPASLPAPTRRWVAAVVARHADAAAFEQLHQIARASTDPLEKQRLYEAMANVRDPALSERMLQIAVSGEPPAGTAPRLVTEVGTEHPELAWRFVLGHEAALAKSLDALSRTTFVPRIAAESADPRRIDELLAYAAKNIPKDARGEVEVAVARIRHAAEIEQKRVPEVDAWVQARR